VSQKQFGKMVALKGQTIVAIDLKDVCDRQKFVDPKGEIVTTAKEIGICFGDA
jgi:hypothetical protein